MNLPTLPLPANPELLAYAHAMREVTDDLLGPTLTPRQRMLLHYRDMLDMASYGALIAIDLTVDLAFVVPSHPAAQGITLDDDALRARIRDMIAMRSAKLN